MIRGVGGGRPSREGVVRLNLSPEAAEQLRALADARGVPPWRMVEDLVMAQAPGLPMHIDGSDFKSNPLPPEIQEIAQEAAAFLGAAKDLSAALMNLRRAWGQAIALARLGATTDIDPSGDAAPRRPRDP